MQCCPHVSSLCNILACALTNGIQQLVQWPLGHLAKSARAKNAVMIKQSSKDHPWRISWLLLAVFNIALWC